MTRGAGKVGLILSVLVLFVAGCTTEQTQPSELSDEPSASAAASPSATSDEQAVADVYKKYFETMIALGSADEATIRAKLAPYAEGLAIERIVAVMANFRSQNQQPAGSVVFGDLEIAIDNDTATVRECRDGTTELVVDSSTGAVISHGPVEGFRAQMKRVNGGWIVTSYDGDTGVC